MGVASASTAAGRPGRARAALCAAARTLLEMLYPPACIACGAGLDPGGNQTFCAPCAATLKPIGRDRCPRCGFPFGPHVEDRAACPDCRRGFPFDRAMGVFRYQDAAREAITRWKYEGDLRAGMALRNRFLAALDDEAFMAEVEVVVPVPLHWTRRLRRRFNQAEFLARAAAKRCGARADARTLRRIRNTPSQVGLTPAQRAENVRGAFRVVRREAVRGRQVLLVDDVLTTCATAAECARTLKLAGAARVYVAALAR